MTGRTRQIWQDETGATAVEYGLLSAFMSLAIVLAIQALTQGVSETFEYLGDQLAENGDEGSSDDSDEGG